jgi:hypothetical protein
VDVRVLGNLEVEFDDGSVADLGGTKPKTLMGVLVAAGGWTCRISFGRGMSRPSSRSVASRLDTSCTHSPIDERCDDFRHP